VSSQSSGRLPQTLDEVVADLMKRVTALEQKRTSRAGEWTLYSNDEGDLVASSPSGNTVVLSDKPEQVVIVQQVTATTPEEGST